MRNDMALSSLGFLSCLIYPILSAGEGGNLETPMGAEKKFQQKLLWTFPRKDKRGGEGQPAKTGHFWPVTSLIQSNTMDSSVAPIPSSPVKR